MSRREGAKHGGTQHVRPGRIAKLARQQRAMERQAAKAEEQQEDGWPAGADIVIEHEE